MSIYKIISVKNSSNYDVIIGNDIIFSDVLSKEVKKLEETGYNKIVFIIDQKLQDIYCKDRIKNNIIYINIEEELKTRETKQHLEDRLLSLGCARDTVLIAIGGGVLLDLVGFTAATYMRGIPVMYVPTTLLAMVDASVGGKTGINTSYGKNLIGCIKQPCSVIIDINNILTLPNDDYLSAIAEVIKIGLLFDRELCDLLINNYNEIINKDSNILLELIYKSIEHKKNIIEQDEFEKDRRQLLNFGHTIAHSLERNENYKLKHGYAVAIGLWVESEISYRMGVLDQDNLDKIKFLLKLFYNNTIIITNLLDNINKLLVLDKKTKSNKAHYVLLKSIGEYFYDNHQYSFVIDYNISSNIECIISGCELIKK